MPEALRHMLPTSVDEAHATAAVAAYLLSSAAGFFAAGITLGWMWGRR